MLPDRLRSEIAINVHLETLKKVLAFALKGINKIVLTFALKGIYEIVLTFALKGIYKIVLTFALNGSYKIALNPLTASLFVCLFVLLLYVQINSYHHGGTVSSPNHTFHGQA